jgi:hypothetical protein
MHHTITNRHDNNHGKSVSLSSYRTMQLIYLSPALTKIQLETTETLQESDQFNRQRQPAAYTLHLRYFITLNHFIEVSTSMYVCLSIPMKH